jgi:hypothetical protein
MSADGDFHHGSHTLGVLSQMIRWAFVAAALSTACPVAALDLKRVEIGKPYSAEQARAELGISEPCKPGAYAGTQLCDGETTIDQVPVKTHVVIGVTGNVEVISLKFGSLLFEMLEPSAEKKYGKPTSVKAQARTIGQIQVIDKLSEWEMPDGGYVSIQKFTTNDFAGGRMLVQSATERKRMLDFQNRTNM